MEIESYEITRANLISGAYVFSALFDDLIIYMYVNVD